MLGSGLSRWGRSWYNVLGLMVWKLPDLGLLGEAGTEGRVWERPPTHPLPGEGEAAPSLASCLGQLNCQEAQESSAEPVAYSLSRLPWHLPTP